MRCHAKRVNAISLTPVRKVRKVRKALSLARFHEIRVLEALYADRLYRVPPRSDNTRGQQRRKNSLTPLSIDGFQRDDVDKAARNRRLNV